ncbi:hypothetical protein V2J09_005503 [Rumex salicifolius]
MAFVTGAAKKPDPASPLFAQWERCNSMVTSWIFHSVEKDIAESLLFFDTAAEIWEDLKLRELRSDAPLGVDSSAMAASSNGGGGRGQSNFNTRGGGRGGRGSSRGGRSGSDRKSLYFCDHCKTQGHTIDRCFKLHGYPPQRNDKPQGSGSFSGSVDVPSSSNSGSFQHSGPNSPDSVPNLTRFQYNQLLALLGKLDSTDTAPKSSMMAGPFSEHISGSW